MLFFEVLTVLVVFSIFYWHWICWHVQVAALIQWYPPSLPKFFGGHFLTIFFLTFWDYFSPLWTILHFVVDFCTFCQILNFSLSVFIALFGHIWRFFSSLFCIFGTFGILYCKFFFGVKSFTIFGTVCHFVSLFLEAGIERGGRAIRSLGGDHVSYVGQWEASKWIAWGGDNRHMKIWTLRLLDCICLGANLVKTVYDNFFLSNI